MRTLLLIICMMLISVMAWAESDIIGRWETGKENTVVEIAESAVGVCGRVVSTEGEVAKAGTLILKDIKQDGGVWEGSIFSVKRNEWYNAEIRQEADTLYVKVSVGFMSKTFEWKKLE